MEQATGRGRGVQLKLPVSPEAMLRTVREQVLAEMRVGVLDAVRAIFEEERRELIGQPWSRKEPGRARSGGSEEGSIYLEGRRIPMRYPRVADEGGSRAIEAYRALRSFDLMGEEVQAKLVRGISTRDYRDVAARIASGTGLSKSTVSRAFVRVSAKTLDRVNGRDLSTHEFVALFLDGIGFGDVLVVAAMGVTMEGRKILLGLREGHTENAAVVSELLESLVGRGLTLTERFLAVIDGSKALRAAVARRWGGRAAIQRCQQHKKRNVAEHLPPQYQGEARRRMSVAYGMERYDEAKKVLQNAVGWLEQINVDAARSLEEGLEETLTVVKLGLPSLLRRTFATTNPLESVFDGVRYRTRRVKRWKKGAGQMVLRWTAAAATETERRLRKIRGFRLLVVMREALSRELIASAKEAG